MADTATLRPPVRKRFTVTDVEAMIRAGVIEEGGPEELLDGEIWVAPAEGGPHVDLKTWLNARLVKGAPETIGVACDSTLRLQESHAPSPAFYLFPASMRASQVRGPDVLLLIEIAETSLRADLAIKGPKYREYGVREYWAVDIAARVTHVHRRDGAWPDATPVPFDADIAPQCAPELKLRMTDSGV